MARDTFFADYGDEGAIEGVVGRLGLDINQFADALLENSLEPLKRMLLFIKCSMTSANRMGEAPSWLAFHCSGDSIVNKKKTCVASIVKKWGGVPP